MGRLNWLTNGDYHIYSEYCPGLYGFAYMGWWLYAAPIVDGEPDKERAVWLSCDWELKAVLSGLELLPMRSQYKEAFRDRYPMGIDVSVEGWGYCCKVTKLQAGERRTNKSLQPTPNPPRSGTGDGVGE